MRALKKLAEIFKETSVVSGEIVARPRLIKITENENQTTKPSSLPRMPIEHTMYHKKTKVPIAISCIPRLPPLPKTFHKMTTTLAQ